MSNSWSRKVALSHNVSCGRTWRTHITKIHMVLLYLYTDGTRVAGLKLPSADWIAPRYMKLIAITITNINESGRPPLPRSQLTSWEMLSSLLALFAILFSVVQGRVVSAILWRSALWNETKLMLHARSFCSCCLLFKTAPSLRWGRERSQDIQAYDCLSQCQRHCYIHLPF